MADNTSNTQPSVKNQKPADDAGRGLPSRKIVLWIAVVITGLLGGLMAVDQMMPKHHTRTPKERTQSQQETASQKPRQHHLTRILNKEGTLPPIGLGATGSSPVVNPESGNSGSAASSSGTTDNAPNLTGNNNDSNSYGNNYGNNTLPANEAGNDVRTRSQEEAVNASIAASPIVALKGHNGASHHSASPSPWPNVGALPLPTALNGQSAVNPLAGTAASLAALAQAHNKLHPSRSAADGKWLKRQKTHHKQTVTRVHPPRPGVALYPGTTIPAILMTHVDTQLPGTVVAQIIRNIYSPKGRLAIPGGTKAVGSYDARVFNGQTRTLLAFHELIFPNGSTIDLGGAQGSGIQGAAGVASDVNNHLWTELGTAFLVGEIANVANIGGSSSAGSTTNNYGGGSSSSLGAGGQVIVNESQNILNPYMNIPPTLNIKPGTSFTIMVNKTVVFSR